MTTPDYGKIIHRSWELTWKNKWLWVYGLVLAFMGSGGYSGGGGSGSSSSSSSSRSVQQIQNNVPADLPKEGQKVLGQATNLLASWLQNVPATTWLLLFLGLVLFLLFALILNMVITAWAKGSLISGLEMADSDEAVGLIETSKRGIAKIKNLIIFGLISLGIVLGLILIATVLFIIIGVLISVLSGAAQVVLAILFGIVGIAGFITLFVVLVILSMVGIYAERLIVLKNVAPWEAWKKGLSLSKGNFLHTALMGIINLALGCTISCLGLLALLVLLGIPGVIIVLPMFTNGFHFVAGSFIGLVILIVMAIYINLLLRAVLVVFDTGNWNLFFKQVMESEGSEKEKI